MNTKTAQKEAGGQEEEEEQVVNNEKNETKLLCKYFFGERYCKYGDSCWNSHSREQYRNERKVQDCPNAVRCLGFISEHESKCRRCSEPFFSFRPKFYSSRPRYKCANTDCQNRTTYRYCRICYRGHVTNNQ